MIHLITYDLRKPGRAYSPLYEVIKSNGAWAHPLESVWFVETRKSPGEVRDHLKNQVDSNDVVYVARLHRNWASRNFSKEIVDWLNDPHRTW